MTHGGEELALGFARRFRFLARGDELFPGRLELAHGGVQLVDAVANSAFQRPEDKQGFDDEQQQGRDPAQLLQVFDAAYRFAAEFFVGRDRGLELRLERVRTNGAEVYVGMGLGVETAEAAHADFLGEFDETPHRDIEPDAFVVVNPAQVAVRDQRQAFFRGSLRQQPMVLFELV